MPPTAASRGSGSRPVPHAVPIGSSAPQVERAAATLDAWAAAPGFADTPFGG